jgi:hypothetical protein
MADPIKLHLSRLGVGAVAGLVVAIVKYAGNDVDYATQLLAMDWTHIFAAVITYATIPVVLGAVGGWISTENTVPKIFWFALTAPVILAAAAGAEQHKKQPQYLPEPGKAGWNFEQILPISPAYGAEAFAADKVVTPNSSGANTTNPFSYGFKLFLGQEGPRYRLVVHSVINDKQKAEAVANRLNRDFKLPAPATVGERKPNNPYWPIVLNSWTTYAEAKKLKDDIQGMNFGFDDDDNPYISVEGR